MGNWKREKNVFSFLCFRYIVHVQWGTHIFHRYPCFLLKTFMNRGEVSFEEQIMSEKKYTDIFPRIIGAIVFTFFARENIFMNSLLFSAWDVCFRVFSGTMLSTNTYFPSAVKTTKRSLRIEFKQRVVLVDVRFKSWGYHLGDILGYSPVLAEEYFLTWFV